MSKTEYHIKDRQTGKTTELCRKYIEAVNDGKDVLIVVPFLTHANIIRNTLTELGYDKKPRIITAKQCETHRGFDLDYVLVDNREMIKHYKDLYMDIMPSLSTRDGVFIAWLSGNTGWEPVNLKAGMEYYNELKNKLMTYFDVETYCKLKAAKEMLEAMTGMELRTIRVQAYII